MLRCCLFSLQICDNTNCWRNGETSRAEELGSGGGRKVTRSGNNQNVPSGGCFVGWRMEQSMLVTNLTASHPVVTYKHRKQELLSCFLEKKQPARKLGLEVLFQGEKIGADLGSCQMVRNWEYGHGEHVVLELQTRRSEKCHRSGKGSERSEWESLVEHILCTCTISFQDSLGFYLNKGECLYKVCLWKCFFWMCHCMVICSCKAKIGIQTLSIMFVNFSLDKICNLREWNGIDMCTHAGGNVLWQKQRKEKLRAVHWKLEGVQGGVGLLHCVPWDAINYCVWVSAQSSKLYFICSKYLQLYPSSAS